MSHAVITREVPVYRPNVRRRYPFKHMQPGWSFRIVPDNGESLAQLDVTVRAALRSFQKSFPDGRAPQFEVYVTRIGAVPGIRCTRLAALGPNNPADLPKFKANLTSNPLPYGRVKPGECFDVRIPDGCPAPLALQGVRRLIRWHNPHSVFRLEHIKTEAGKKEFIRVFRYI